ncbi:MAG: RdgB/HAM1 family non-canonical purine NTP pyrophosphatase [Acidimicrobiales bacterium]
MSAKAGRWATFVLATANRDKASEIRQVLSHAPFVLVERPSQVGEVDETGETLIENARLKAVTLAVATGLAALADDTGLEVAALDGAPGVYSARYAGEHASYNDNVAKLLRELTGAQDRNARFSTVALAWFPDGAEIVASASVEGRIATVPRGRGGFGYDPVFIPTEGDGRTFAEMTPGEKHSLSHRGRAFTLLGERLEEHLRERRAETAG